ncbi:MAG: hypothetical protein LC778_20625 [Acidobacteria bacterium]|nr:hypothetical protein [Acidobacteriota bacterium]
MKLSTLAEKTFAVIEQGDADLEIKSAAGLDIAENGEITFLANPKYTPQIKQTRASAIFLNETETIERRDIVVLRTKDPYLAYTRALRIFHPKPKTIAFVHSTAVIHETAIIAQDVEINASVFIGKNCVIENNVRIFPNVTVYDNVRIGKNSVIHSGVAIRENCELGANCIVHGKRVILAGQVGIAGHLRVGDDVVLRRKAQPVTMSKMVKSFPAFQRLTTENGCARLPRFVD